VIGTVNVLEGSTVKDSNVTASGGLDRVRVEASGANDDETFGGWVRLEGFAVGGELAEEGPVTEHMLAGNYNNDPISLFKAHGFAWWKPIDQLKLTIGGNPDGHFGKDGMTCWMFYQSASDTGVVTVGNAWGGGYGGWAADGMDQDHIYGVFRNAFYGGFGQMGLMLNITPAEIVDINVGIPFFAGTKNKDGKENLVADKFKMINLQLDFKLDFGNIAVTYVGNLLEGNDQPTVFGYFGLTSIENLGIDFGLGYTFPTEDGDASPIWIGLGVKYTMDAFGVKFRALGGLGGDDKITHIRADVLPFYALSDSLRAYVSIGIGMAMGDGIKAGTGESSSLDWHFNPYLEAGSEWGPKFLVGIKAWSENNGDHVNWAVPIALTVSF